MEIFAEHALTETGWQRDVLVSIEEGAISAVRAGAAPSGQRVFVLLPGITNLHSHAFQRAMAGLAEARSPAGRDTFWTWREVMYRFVEMLSPDDVEAIAAFCQVEMLEAGFTAVGEFHYLHHQADGTPYDGLAEMAERIAAAAAQTGIGLTLLPVLYQVGGCDGRALEGGQRRFGSDPDRFAALLSETRRALGGLPEDARWGVAPHSLRAVTPEGLAAASALADEAPVHIHVAEQVREVEEVQAAMGARPVDWLLGHADVDERWCLIHATHMSAQETGALARTGATAGLCPVTEANLGDGIFPLADYLSAGGGLGVGTDSNIAISLIGELRQLEYAQRLGQRERAVAATPERSTGRTLYEAAATGGAKATMRNAGLLAPGRLADLVAFDADFVDGLGRSGDRLLDGFVFAGAHNPVREVWSAGRHVVKEGRHVAREAVAARYSERLRDLMGRL